MGREESITLKQQNESMHTELETLRAENASYKEKLNEYLTNLNEKQSEYSKLCMQNEACVKERDALQTEVKAMKENESKSVETNESIPIEKNQIIQTLKEQKSEADEEIVALNKQMDAMRENVNSLQLQVSESKNDSNAILEQSKLRMDKMKKQFKAHRNDLIKRILEFVYIKYDEMIKEHDGDDSEFNYIGFFRAITKKIIANPDDFDEEEESLSSDNAEEED